MSYWDYSAVSFSELVGRTLVKIEKVDSDALNFVTDDGRTFKLYHDQDCCESVYLEDVNGDLEDLVGSPILQADELSNEPEPECPEDGYEPDSYTWTFYRLGTAKGTVVLRWYGSSNGYYSESVTFVEVK